MKDKEGYIKKEDCYKLQGLQDIELPEIDIDPNDLKLDLEDLDLNIEDIELDIEDLPLYTLEDEALLEVIQDLQKIGITGNPEDILIKLKEYRSSKEY